MSQLAEDAALVEDAIGGGFLAISGLDDGGWQPLAAPPGSTSLFGTDHYLAVEEPNEVLHAFSPIDSSWTPTPGPLAAGTPVAAGAALGGSTFAAGDSLGAFATRWGRWTLGPPASPGSVPASGGTALAWYDEPAGRALAFDERKETWVGRALAAPLTWVTGDEVLLALAGDGVTGWSAQRGDWTALPAPAATPTDSGAEAGVAWLTTAEGELWAFGGACSIRVFDDWPDGTDVVHPSTTGSIDTTIAGEPDELATILISFTLQDAPFGIPGIAGTVWIGQPTFTLNTLVLSSDGAASLSLPIGVGVPTGLQLWMQPILLDPVELTLSLGRGCGAGLDPLRIRRRAGCGERPRAPGARR